MESGEFLKKLDLKKEMWRLETLSPLLKKSPKNQKKPWNTLREEHASSSSSGRTGSSKGFDVVARERGGSARKFG
jgi:hypothetical protein